MKMSSETFPEFVIIDANHVFGAFDYYNGNIQYHEKIEIIRQCIAKLDHGAKSVESALGNVLNFNLLSTQFTEPEKQTLNAIASDITTSLFLKCCEYKMFSANNTNTDCYFPYFPELVSNGGIAFTKSDPY